MALSQVLRLFSPMLRDGASRERSRFPRAVRPGALRLAAAAFAVLMGGAAWANGPSLVVDAESGRVLHADRATDPWFPASITKLMTTYVAFDLVRQGRVGMDTLLTVSETAYALPPSKMAFRPGSQIRLDNALRIIMVKSANDVAATIAENLGGSVEGFAALMNDTALRIGMRESHWTNPHGLPDERQYTSARDMAVLARALMRDFPEHADLFHIGAIRFGRRIMRNHNGLIGRYPGADGMKTGFICAGGFNVVATASRNGRRLITVVMGSSSANERTLKAAELFDLGFERSSTFNPSLEALPASASLAPPNMRSVICDRRGPVPGEDDGGMTVAAGAESSGLFSVPNLMAYAGGTLAPANRTVLGPRAAVQPVDVWLGANPPNAAEAKAQAEAEDAEEKARLDRKAKRGKAVAARPAAEDADATAKPAPEAAETKPKPAAKPVAARPAPAKPAASESAAAKPAAAKPVPAEGSAAKPAPKPAAKPAPQVAAKPDPAAKPAAAAPKPAADEGKAAAKPAARKPVKPEAKPQAEKPEARKAGAPKAAEAAKPEPRKPGAKAAANETAKPAPRS
ncbi:MAG TPA: D-alanyl-D-alanine carboxypeptidase family protein [Microvirga sp.]|jgi:D-alanyl-D-alanine carboxypeptidase|nr:D-alanyl-D-alanine carboxypeptidase family protein [Microvirga sp.]